MESYNVCKFNAFGRAPDVINTVYFVLETKKSEADAFRFDAVYKVYCVKRGCGRLHTSGGITEVKCGEVFFTFPSVSYAIESVEDFEYYYIGFIGIRASQLTERYGINFKSFHFPLSEKVLETWEYFFSLGGEGNLDIISESTLLYTLAEIGNLTKSRETGDSPENFLEVKKYIDDNISDPSLDLELIGKALGYNKTYLSALFKKHMGESFKSYVTTLRIQNASALMKKNITSIKDIAFLCGFSDPLYFSKVFKKHTGLSPKEFSERVDTGES